MPRKQASKPRKTRDPEEYKRFLEAAKTAEASDNPKDLERALKRVAPKHRQAKMPR